MKKPMSTPCTRFFTIVLMALPLAVPHALGEVSPDGQVAKFSIKDAKLVKSRVMRPNPIDKFYALDAALPKNAINWKEVLNATEVNVDPDTLKDTKVTIPALLGFRICDGVMAIKARDAEKLNSCATHIEKMGKKLGVTDEDLRRAKIVRSFANRGEWGRVFLELGYLQQDIERVLERVQSGDSEGEGGSAPVTKILYAAGWIQGARYTSNLVKVHYDKTTGCILREPNLVKELKADLDKAAEKLKADGMADAPIIKLMSEAMSKLEKLVSVELRAPLSQASVEAMAKLTTDTVNACVKTTQGAKEAK